MKLPFFQDNAPTPTEQTLRLRIKKMHCTSCSLIIDGELENTAGVIRARTNYARGISTIVYTPSMVTPEALIQVITALGYEVDGGH